MCNLFGGVWEFRGMHITYQECAPRQFGHDAARLFMHVLQFAFHKERAVLSQMQFET